MKRMALGFTREEVCARCGGMSEKTLSRLESGKANVRKESIRELLNLYHQSSHMICTALETKDPSDSGLYLEILLLIFQKNYREAERKLDLLESYVEPESETSKRFLEIRKRTLCYLMGQKELDGKKTLEFLEEWIAGIVPEGADLAEWPLSWQEITAYVEFFNILAMEGQYGRIIPTARKLLLNLERHYHNTVMFVNLYGCLTRCLIHCMFEEGQWGGIVEQAQKGLEICAVIGDITNTYRIKGELINYYWMNDFFQSEELKEQCLKNAKDGYALSAICEDKKMMRYYRRYLKEAHGYKEVYPL